MPKDTVIQIRVSEKDKAGLQQRAESMYMSLSSYLVHAGMVYTPSDKVERSRRNLEKVFAAMIEDQGKLNEYLKEVE